MANAEAWWPAQEKRLAGRTQLFWQGFFHPVWNKPRDVCEHSSSAASSANGPGFCNNIEAAAQSSRTRFDWRNYSVPSTNLDKELRKLGPPLKKSRTGTNELGYITSNF